MVVEEEKYLLCALDFSLHLVRQSNSHVVGFGGVILAFDLFRSTPLPRKNCAQRCCSSRCHPGQEDLPI